MDSSEFRDFLSNRVSVREYYPGELSESQVEYILGCASTAPSAGNLEAWDVVIVFDDEEKTEISAAAFEQRHVEEASALFIVCANYVRSMSRYGERGILYAVQDATIACTYMMLGAHALGLHSCWVGAMDEGEVRSIAGLPSHLRPVAILCVGKGRLPGAFTPRMAAGEHVHYGTWEGVG
ncbi:MAG: nitroreductase family protein [Methanoregulaceae archaeon]|nr:nitroreductase family protein [Methanoregulaceae archaeon]